MVVERTRLSEARIPTASQVSASQPFAVRSAAACSSDVHSMNVTASFSWRGGWKVGELNSLMVFDVRNRWIFVSNAYSK
jgi:hypothetical protein